MNALALDPSLAAPTRHGIGLVVQTPAPDKDQRSLWQREMERAEADAWFRQPPEAPTCATAGSTSLKFDGSRREIGQSPDRRSIAVADASPASERPAANDRDVSRTDARRGPVSSDDAARADATPSAGAGPTATEAGKGATAVPVARRGPAADGRHTMNGTVKEGASDAEPLAPLSRSPAEPRRLSVRATGTSSVATMSQGSAELRQSTGARLVASMETLSTPTLPSVSVLTADDRFVAEKKVIEVGTSGSLQRAMLAATVRLSPLRMHIEWNGDAAAVWVGIDQAGEASLAGLIACLSETLSRNGLRLRSVVCNGNRRFHVDATTADDKLQFKPVDIFMESES